MSDKEIYEAHGRALAEAKKLRAEVAAIQTNLEKRNTDLKAVARAIDQLLQNPDRRDPGAPMPPSAAIAHQLTREIDLASMAVLAEDLFRKASELRLLEERLARF